MQIFVANKSHSIYAGIICDTIAESAMSEVLELLKERRVHYL